MIDYEEDWILPLVFRRSGGVSSSAAIHGGLAVVVSLFLAFMDDWAPEFREDNGMLTIGVSLVWSATTAVLLFLVGFRAQQGYARFWEGTGLLHQMRGEWFDTVSNCVTFSIGAKADKPVEVMAFRHTLVRLMSLAHGAALEEISGNQAKLQVIDMFGLDANTLGHLKECSEVHNFNKVEVILHLTQSLITQALQNDVMKIPAPVCSRVYQTLSRGFVNLLNAKKITDTKFPFPFVQVISVMLLSQIFLTPMMLSAVITNRVILPIVAFLPVFGMFSLNYIAMQLENPFGDDDNDLPLDHFQHEMNTCLLMLLHPNTDMIAGTSPRCVMDFHAMRHTLRTIDDSMDEIMPTQVPKARPAPNKILDNTFKLGENWGGSPHDANSPESLSLSDDVDEFDGMFDPHKVIETPPQDSSPPGTSQSSRPLRRLSSNQVVLSTTPAIGCVTRPNGPIPFERSRSAVCAIPEPFEMRPRSRGKVLQHSMEDFNNCLANWTQLLEQQVQVLEQTLHRLREERAANLAQAARQSSQAANLAQAATQSSQAAVARTDSRTSLRKPAECMDGKSADVRSVGMASRSSSFNCSVGGNPPNV